MLSGMECACRATMTNSGCPAAEDTNGWQKCSTYSDSTQQERQQQQQQQQQQALASSKH